ncbi:MAG: biosynthetic-type acetolactate synthase large subunit [Holophaga sp.]|nr:biosynthetic-type acetolactate synthase large subunit [Holophaga sp.]
MTQTGATILWECLQREGVEVVFGYPGGAIMPVYDALLESSIHHVLARHEQGAAHMADGYARASGRTGVILSTSGPGATNLVTGLATAMMDSVPLVAITGQVNSKLLGSDAFQEVDVTGVTLPVTKHNYLVTKASEIAPALREAFALARAGRQGPVLVDITKDAQLEAAQLDWEAAAPSRHLRHQPLPLHPEKLEAALAMIGSSRRPLILAGHGVLLSGAVEALRAFAEKAQIPLAATLLGLDAFPSSHPLFLGFMGMHGAPWVNRAIQEADLLLAFGMRFDDRVTGRIDAYAPHARKIHVDIDAAEFGRNVAVDLALHGDLNTVLKQLLPDLSTLDTAPWRADLTEWRRDHGGPQWPLEEDDHDLKPLRVLRELQRLAKDAILVTDVGQHQMWLAQVTRLETPHTFITSGGLGTMGFGLPAAIGVKIAKPECEVWVVAGDGGIQMNSQEFMTLVQEGIKVNVAVLNNASLGMVRQWQTLFFEDRRSAVGITSPDFVKLAEAYGLKGLRVTRWQDVTSAITEAQSEPGPVLIDFWVDPEAGVFPIVAPGKALGDMLHESSPST